MQTFIPAPYADSVAVMQAAQTDILAALERHGIRFDAYPTDLPPGRPKGAAAAQSFPMQGILKYHGMSDWDWRIAYLPSISVSNDAGYTLTYVEFDPELERDIAFIGGKEAHGRDLERVVQSLDVVRQAARVQSRARMVSRNVVRASKVGKGLGSSASASAALAAAAAAALWGPELIENRRFLSCLARMLAGSGCRSATGGLSLWLSYPGAPHEESFAVRLDNREQLADMRLITVPIDSRVGLKTEEAHRDAPDSSLFKPWMYSRRDEILTCIDAIQAGDWRTLGRWAELDSIRLHGVTMSGSMENKIFGWEPENIALFRMCNDLRSEGVPVYFSTDTGPTVVFLLHKDSEEAVAQRIHSLNMGFEVIRGNIAGPTRLVELGAARAELGIA
jgi:diphosphomevalonate decarboxylase